jgi:hypothetical protein
MDFFLAFDIPTSKFEDMMEIRYNARTNIMTLLSVKLTILELPLHHHHTVLYSTEINFSLLHNLFYV